METKEKLNKLFKMQFESEQINETFDGLKKANSCTRNST